MEDRSRSDEGIRAAEELAVTLAAGANRGETCCLTFPWCRAYAKTGG
jgi:hypothetical protein